MPREPLAGLDYRLRMRSRRSGLVIGMSVASAIVVLVAAFTVLFASLDPMISDFISANEDSAPVSNVRADEPAPTSPQVAAAATEQVAAAATEPVTPQPTPPPTELPSTPASDPFKPNLVVSSSRNINLREGPGVRFPVVVVVRPGTAVQQLEGREVTSDPAADQLSVGREWIEVRLESGDEGWIRDVDLSTR